MNAKVLIVEDDISVGTLLSDTVSGAGHTVLLVESAELALNALEEGCFDIIVTDVNLPGQSGLDLLTACRQVCPEAYLLVMTGYGTIEVAVQAMKLGAADFLSKPISISDFETVIKVAVDKLGRHPAPVRGRRASDSLVAKSEIMKNLMTQVETIAPFKLNALITGETGTGKELIARAVHRLGPRCKSPFVAINCAAIPEQLLEDELFGHVKGAFTGAQTDRKGRFEQADGGTLFLDEIGDMDLTLQSKLLRILQESEFERLGSTKTLKVDVRVVAATSADLTTKLANGSFRADLYHRLNVVHLSIPPLRRRPDDIIPLAKELLLKFCSSTGLPEKTIAEEAYHALLSYSFPGNVRQLQNCMERAAVFSGLESEIRVVHLPEEIRRQQNAFQTPEGVSVAGQSIPDDGIDFSRYVSGIERDLLLKTLDKTGGNKMQAAKLLNMKRTTLVEKIKRLNIDVDENEADEAVA